MLKATHLLELCKSGVDRNLTKLNVRSLDGDEIYNYLTWQLINQGIETSGILRNDRYSHCEAGGWWCSGIDVFSGEESDWGIVYRFLLKYDSLAGGLSHG